MGDNPSHKTVFSHEKKIISPRCSKKNFGPRRMSNKVYHILVGYYSSLDKHALTKKESFTFTPEVTTTVNSLKTPASAA